MPVRERPIPPKPGFLSRSLTGLGNFAKFYKSAIIDTPIDAMGSAVNSLSEMKLPGVRRAMAAVDRPEAPDALERRVTYDPDTGMEMPLWNKAQEGGFASSMIGQANALNALQAAAWPLRVAGGTVETVGWAAPAFRTAAKVIPQALDWSSIVGGGKEVAEGLAEGDWKRGWHGALSMAMGGLGRATANHAAPEGPLVGNLLDSKFEMAVPERPAQTPLERIREERFAELFGDEQPVSKGAIAAREAALPPPTFTPTKPRPGQATLQPATDAPIAPADSGLSVAERARRLRLKSPRQQDAGIIPQARPPVGPEPSDLDILDHLISTGEEHPWVVAQRDAESAGALAPVEPAPVVNNASGESAASVESINRENRIKAAGGRHVIQRGNSYIDVPVDAHDRPPGRGETKGILYEDGRFEVVERGENAPYAPVQPQPRAVEPEQPTSVPDEDVVDVGDINQFLEPDVTPAVAPDVAAKLTPQQYMLGWLADDLEALPGEPLQKGQSIKTRRLAYESLDPAEAQALTHQPMRAAGTPTYQLLDSIPGLKGKNYAAKAQYLRRVMAGEIENPALIEAVDKLRAQFDPNTHAFKPGTGPSPATPPPGDTPADVLRAMFGDEEAARMIQAKPQPKHAYTKWDRLVNKARRESAMEQAARGGDTSFDVVDEIAGVDPEHGSPILKITKAFERGDITYEDALAQVRMLEGDATGLSVDPERRKVLQGFERRGGRVNEAEGLPPDPDVMDMIAGRRAARPPVVDTLPTGEAQPRLPGDVGDVRGAEVETPQLAPPPEETFGLTPPPVKAPEQPTLAQSLPPDVPTLAPEPEVAPQAPAAPKATVPANVQAYLVKQLGYTPEAVAGMTPEQAITIGRAKTPPEGAAARQPKPVPPAAPSAAIVQDASLPSTRNVPIRGKRPVAVRPVDAGEGAPLAGKTTPVEAEPAALAAAAKRVPETTPAPVQTAREKGTNPRAIERANAAGQRWAESNGTDVAAGNEWATAMANEAEQAGRQAVKEGHNTRRDSGPKIYSNPLGDPELWKKVGKALVTTKTGRFYMGAVGGALIGHEEDDPFSATATDALLGGMVAMGLNRNQAKNAFAALQRIRTGQGLYGERGVRPVLPDAAEKWSAWDRVRSPQRSIPDVMRKVQPKFEAAEQAIRGFDAQGRPLKNFEAEKYTPSELKLEPKAREKARRARVTLAVKDSLQDTRRTLREEGKRLWESGEKEKARLVRELLARVENRPTKIAEILGGAFGEERGRQLDSALAHAQYWQSLAWNFGLGKILNPMQKYFAMLYVPWSAIRRATKLAKTPEGRARTDFLIHDRAADDPGMLDMSFMERIPGEKKATALWERFMEKTGKDSLVGSDNDNRRVVYLAASDYAKAKGGVQTGKGFDSSPEAIHRWAMDVVGQTQGVVGPMGQSPYVSRVGKSATTFTKFSTLALELAHEAVDKPRPETLGLVAVAASMAMANKALPDEYELDLMKMFAPRAMTSLPALGQVKNAYSQLTNQNQPLPERLARTLIPDAPERYFDELFGEGGFLDEGMGTHRHPNRYGSLDEHSGYDALARLLGIETKANSQRILESQQQRKFQQRTTAESAEASRPQRQADKEARLLKSKPGKAGRDDVRRQVPKKSREEYDARFGK